MSDKIDNVSVGKKANVFFDGKCVSHSVFFPDGSRKTVGVVLPNSQLTFNVGTPELMEIAAAPARSRLPENPLSRLIAEGTVSKSPPTAASIFILVRMQYITFAVLVEPASPALRAPLCKRGGAGGEGTQEI